MDKWNLFGEYEAVSFSANVFANRNHILEDILSC